MTTESILIAIVAAIIAIVVGFFIGRSSGAKTSEQNAELETELQKTRQDVEEYRTQVSKHFEKTAELVGDMTSSYKDMTNRYKAVYEHLAVGAQSLSAADTSKMIAASPIDQLMYEANNDTDIDVSNTGVKPESRADETAKNVLDATRKPASTDSGKLKAGEKQSIKPSPPEDTPGQSPKGSKPPAAKPEPVDAYTADKKHHTAPDKTNPEKK